MNASDYLKAYFSIKEKVVKANQTKEGSSVLVANMSDIETVGYLLDGFGSPEIALRYISMLQDETFFDVYKGIRKRWTGVKFLLIRLVEQDKLDLQLIESMRKDESV